MKFYGSLKSNDGGIQMTYPFNYFGKMEKMKSGFYICVNFTLQSSIQQIVEIYLDVIFLADVGSI